MTLEVLFPEWYALVDPGFSGEKIVHRLAAISKIASSLAIADALDLVATFYSQDSSASFTERLRTQLREVDSTFVSHDRAELAVVCGGVLYSLFEKPSDLGYASSLLLLCGDFGGLQGTSRIDAVVIRAQQYLVDEGTKIRESALSFPNFSDLLKSASKKLQIAKKERANGEAEAEVDDSFEIHADTLSALKSFGAALTSSLERMEKRRLEESSVLYWLLGGRALDSEEPFSKIEKPKLAFIAAHDLARQTQHLPGPASCRAILKSVLALGKGSAQQVSTTGCISKMSAEDGDRLLKNAKAYNPVFMPLSFALEKAREVNWEQGWESAFAVQTKLKASANRTLEEVSEQFYREILLTRLLTGV